MAEKNHPVNDLLAGTIQKIKEMVDSNTVVGTQITMPDGTVVLPVSKITYGFASGGSDIGSKHQKELFGGGSGAGVSVTPVAFLVCKKNGDVRILNVCTKANGTVDKVVDLMPDMVDKIASFIPNPNDNKQQEQTEE